MDKPMEITKNSQPSSRIVNISLSSIKPNKYQPRLSMDKKKLKELSESIRENGIIQPILVRKLKDSFEIIAGERRYRAAKLIGREEIPCIIQDIKEEDSARLALIENLQREDLNIVDEAWALKKILKDFNYTQEKLAKEIGKSRSYVANTVRILDLDSKVLEYLIDEKISLGHGKVLLSIENQRQQREIAGIIIDKKLTVRETEDLIRKKKNKVKEKDYEKKDSHILSLENQLMMSLGTKVNLLPGKKKGIIEIEYYGEEDLDRILNLIN